VIAWFGSAGVYCYDFEGRELWQRDLGRQSHVWGYAASPILYGDQCIVNFGPGQRSFVVALDKRSGKTVWQFDVPPIPADAKWEDFGTTAAEWTKLGYNTVAEISGSCSTPVIVRANGHDELVVALELRVQALAPKTGKPLWRCDGHNTCAYGSPFFGDGLVVASETGFRNCLMAIRSGGRGNVTGTHRVWHFDPPSSKACIGSGLIHQGRIYQVTSMGFVQCLDLQTGKTLWDERLTGSGAKNSSWSSPLLAGDRLYVPNQNADVFVLRAGPKFECLATNSLVGEMMNASLAVSDGEVFLRTHQSLWCVAEAKKP
jgi:outer membrane protein assembly factor BamB